MNDDIDAFVMRATSSFDASHDINHARNVYALTMRIARSMDLEGCKDVLTFASKLHDVCDHKYSGGITRDELIEFIASHLGDIKAQNVMKIIDNVSYSTEISGMCETLDEPLNTYLTVIRDADRLEALGYAGIERCITYSRSRGGKVPEDVIQHCHDKLLKLYPDGFIRTALGRELARPLHDEVQRYVERNNSRSSIAL